ncbi:protein CURLY FLAG LEAF 1-like [Phragmites australis]|uniref:protein CURLY FLAG LEAF 1-like n=1 Tax=Phragmites australis TaxID=29695 RepID=UPI002D78613F|nr:protein CURLY FLAG LEAF 1-like [Phragmites australis]
MTTEFVRVKKLHQNGSLSKRMELQPELSLGPTWPAAPPGFASAKSSSSESDGSSRKRKHCAWEEPPVSHAGLELQLNDPVPLDWEQCLDLQSGRMYYLNRKTLKKSWIRPREQSVNLDLNISTTPANDSGSTGAVAAPEEDEPKKPGTMSSGGNMVAVPCANCHLLVMLCKSFPSCPNCKFVQPLRAPATTQASVHRGLDTVKPLETLSLLH